jgi:hypothetical protein
MTNQRHRCTSVCHLAPRAVSDARKLIRAAAEAASLPTAPRAVGSWPEETPPIDSSVRESFPVSILFRDVPRGEPIEITENPDHGSLFLTSFYFVECVRESTNGRVRRVAGRCFLAPPAIPEESSERARLLMQLDKGIPLEQHGDRMPFTLTGRLLPEELESARDLELHDQLALGTVLAARDGLAAMFSPDGEWPRNGLVQSVAERLECRILRLSFDNIPRDVMRRFRHSRYEA